ncbi:HmuY family protein [Flavobacterium silvaticum]|uniref:HmuY protein n=1 Tax=Flavobacterium silvaticum TaxID=1852020 RepID=A0A972JGS7_9FLAO|nr:HmuY family protein [Flavobacterium silvaticum]NMH28511.1 hypothetical protein [Flavobacterium silvaticum]
MKKIILLSLLTVFIAGCSSDNDSDQRTNVEPVTRQIVVDQTGSLTDPVTRYYSLETGLEVTDGSGNWDIAFRRTDIYLNGGTSGSGSVKGQPLASGITYANLDEAPENGYFYDGEGDEMDELGSAEMDNKVFTNWYNYNLETHLVEPKPQVYAIYTNSGKYAKLELQSYVSGAYQLRYTIQPGGLRSFVTD